MLGVVEEAAMSVRRRARSIHRTDLSPTTKLTRNRAVGTPTSASRPCAGCATAAGTRRAATATRANARTSSVGDGSEYARASARQPARCHLAVTYHLCAPSAGSRYSKPSAYAAFRQKRQSTTLRRRRPTPAARRLRWCRLARSALDRQLLPYGLPRGLIFRKPPALHVVWG